MTGRLGRLILQLVITLTLAFLAGCAGSSSSPAPLVQPPDLTAANVIPVKMQPQQPETPPFGDFAAKVPASLIGELNSAPPGHRTSSFNFSDVTRAGTDYDALLPAVKISPYSEQPQALAFEPAWQPGQGLNGAAYCVYQFDLPGYSQSGELPSVGCNYLLLPAVQKAIWVGLANFQTNGWDWYEGQPDGVLTLADFSPYEAPSGKILIALVILGNQPVVLESLRVGQQETRGIGDMGPPPPGSHSMIPHINLALWPLLPDAVDLSPGCAPVNDQGGTGACTAFANADSGFNYELKKTYGFKGWNFANPANRCSPRFVYNQTGLDLAGGCPTGGRTTNDVGTWLLSTGTATEQTAPTGTTAVPGYTCGTGWSAAAWADAAVLRPDTKTFIGTDMGGGNYHWTDADIATAKHVLKTLKHVIIFRTYVDNNFQYLNYTGGACWTYNGASIGGHAMCVVGYDMSKNGGNGAFKVRNSWGSAFGDGGYCWITFDSMKSNTAGVYGYYFTEDCDPAVVSRFLPGAPAAFFPCGFKIWQYFPLYVQLEWEPVEGAVRYDIFRDNPDKPLTSVQAPAVSFQDRSLEDQDAHVYWIQAFDAEGLPSPMSDAAVGWLLPAV